MTDDERRNLVEAIIPLEVLCGQIRHNLYDEITNELQHELLQSLDIIREMIRQEIQ